MPGDGECNVSKRQLRGRSCEYESEVSNPGLSPSLPRSAGWGSPSHSHTRWPPGVGLTNLIRRQGVHTVFYVSVHLLSCHLRLLTDLCGEVLLGHLLGLPALSDQFAHIHVNLVVRLETSWGNSKDVPSTKEHDLELPFTFLWASSSVSWSNFAVFKLVPFWKGFQIQNQMRTET